jgi:murein DD-endopeptidase MepM/ murein hydrolase activator NlpD
MEPTKFKVNTTKGDLRVRKLPADDGELTGITKKKGTIVVVTDEQNGWSKIAEGWVFSGFLLKVEEAVSANPPMQTEETVSAAKPGTAYKFTHQPIIFPAEDKLVLRTAVLPSVKGAMFGMTRTYANGKPKPHQGIDLEVPPGEPVFAVENGVIVDSRVSKDYGKILCLSVTEGTLKGKFFFYAHLNGVNVKIGDRVKAGDRIGLTGSTGNASAMTTIKKGSHLHFEARTVMQAGLGLAGRYDPLPYITLK